MTRKHFQEIADCIKDLQYNGFDALDLDTIAREFAKVLSRFSDRFDTARFVKACTPNDEYGD